MNELRAKFDWDLYRVIPVRVDPAANAVARFQNGNPQAGGADVPCRRQPRGASANNQNIHALVWNNAHLAGEDTGL